jgi:hypothetical protein
MTFMDKDGLKIISDALADLNELNALFMLKWNQKILLKHETSIQHSAAAQIWTRWAMALRALHHLHDNRDYLDIYTLARLGLELEAALVGVHKEISVAREYLDYVNIARRQREDRSNGRLDAKPKKETKSKNKSHWYSGGTGKLIRTFAPDLHSSYKEFCHLAHGNAEGGSWMLEAFQDADLDNARTILAVDNVLLGQLTRFIRRTKIVVELFISPLGSDAIAADHELLLEALTDTSALVKIVKGIR